MRANNNKIIKKKNSIDEGNFCVENSYMIIASILLLLFLFLERGPVGEGGPQAGNSFWPSKFQFIVFLQVSSSFGPINGKSLRNHDIVTDLSLKNILMSEEHRNDQILIFTNTKRGAEILSQEIENLNGFEKRSAFIHGELD